MEETTTYKGLNNTSLESMASVFQGKQPKWVWDLFAFIQVANDIRGGVLPANDPSGNAIEYKMPVFSSYMVVLHALIFFNETLMSKRSLKKVYDAHKEHIRSFLDGNRVKVINPFSSSSSSSSS